MAINFDYNYPQLAREAGFKLRQYKDGPLDWRLIGCLEIERIMRDQSLEQIDSILSHLSEAPLGSILDTNILDSGIAKYFVLSQFSIQYLLFCRKFLDETVRELRESLIESQFEVGKLKKSLAESNNEILQLNKKITQIEAIHEVVYPCHLCSKSFVSNEALNIHIGRKHTDGGGNRSRRNETPLSAAQREKDNDRNLINTIKLELEIKQLKERLNVAEKDIRERSAGNSLRASPHVPTVEKVTRNVAIQSNLMEAKEKDDTISEEDANGSADSAERKEQLLQLQEKIKEFEDWRNLQKVSSEESIGALNKKLAEMAQTLETSKQKREEVTELRQVMNTNMQRRISPSVDDLEKLLTEKVAEIGKASAEKLEEVVFHMEQNYKEKLVELEREIKRKNEATNKITVVHEQAIKDCSVNEAKSNLSNEAPKEKLKDETYIVEDFNGLEKSNSLIAKQALPKDLKETVSSESNRTFVKEEKAGVNIQETAKLPQPTVDEHRDSTDVSETLSEGEETNEEETTTEESDLKSKSIKVLKPQKSLDGKSKIKTEEKLTKSEILKLERQKRSQAAPKKFTRIDAKKLTSRRLSTLGYDLSLSSKSISTANMNKVNAELTERRNVLKKKHPHFMATRSRIRKFVDKLCSKKLPDNAADVLRNTNPQKPLGDLKSKPIPSNNPLSTDESFEALEPDTSIPVREARTNDAFKQRLERLLSSPMRKPESYTRTTTKVNVHAAPVPMPRKRVMFNSDTKDSDDSDAQDDSGSSSVAHFSRSRVTKDRRERKILESSIGSLL